MPITPTYPGVYVEEISSGVRPITGVATSITAFIGRALRGPVDEPIVINSYGDFERVFGGLWTPSTMSFAVKDFYLNGGAQAVIVRLYNPLFASEADRQAAFAAASADAETEADAIIAIVNGAVGDPADSILAAVEAAADAVPAVQAANKAAANSMLAATRDAAGGPPSLSDLIAAANARATTLNAGFDLEIAATAAVVTAIGNTANGSSKAVVIDAMNAAIAALATTQEKAAGQAVADRAATKNNRNAMLTEATAAKDDADAISQARKAATTGFVTSMQAASVVVPAPTADALVVTGNTLAAAAAADVRAAVTDCAGAVAARRSEPPSGASMLALVTAAKPAAIAAGGNAVAPLPNAILSRDGLTLQAAEPGAWGNKLRFRVSAGAPGSDAKTFNLTLLDGTTGRTEEFLGVSTDPVSSRYVANVLQDQSRLVRASVVPALPTPSADPPMPRNAFDPAFSVGVDAANMATDGLSPTAAAYKGNEGSKTGMYALEKTDLFNLLCIPPFTNVDDMDIAVVTEAISYCQRKRAFMIVDSPSTWNSKDTAKAGFSAQPAGTSSSAAMYFPRIRQRNALKDNQWENFAPCGAVAGVMSRTDAQRGVWKAPAGVDAGLVGVPDLSVNLTNAENGELNPLGLNCIRELPAAGRVVWGARTLQGDDRLASEYKYVPVRRLALYLEESLYRGLQWVVFEPNDEPLWGQVRLNVTSFMHRLFRQGAFAGTSPKDAYLVKCDKETTAQEDVNLGIVNILVGFAPLKPAEFVFIQLQQMAGQQQP
jgi:phage tail sheath protein FI